MCGSLIMSDRNVPGVQKLDVLLNKCGLHSARLEGGREGGTQLTVTIHMAWVHI